MKGESLIAMPSCRILQGPEVINSFSANIVAQRQSLLHTQRYAVSGSNAYHSLLSYLSSGSLKT